MRIVTLDPFSSYTSFDLGHVPVGVQEGLSSVINPDYLQQYEQLPKLGSYAKPNLEAIAALAPDLILASTGQKAAETKLSAIARTVLVAGTTSSTWPQAAAQTAEAIGRSGDLEDLRRRYEEHATRIAGGHADLLSATHWAMVWQGSDTGFSIRSPRSNGGQVLARAGVQFTAATPQEEQDLELSWEQIDRLSDADVICLPGTSSGAANPQTELIRDQEVFAGLPAVKAGNVLVLDNMTPGSYVSASTLLAELDRGISTLS